jgi:hypothetical protein
VSAGNGRRIPSSRPPSRPGWRRPVLLRLAAAILVAALLAIGVAVAARSALLHEAVYAVWLVPLGELVLLGAGQYYYRFRFRRAPGKFRLLILQITTTGEEQARVNEIIASVRGYRLPMRHEVWVATEPGHENCYPEADRVIVVPADFWAHSQRKARALEYTRRLRAADGLGRADVKILYNDDDVLPTRQYILTAFDADYDVCEGITAPRTEYGTIPAGHLVASHADDVRARQCLIYCSVFQGLLGQPLNVHGEGLTVTGAAEQLVTWDYPVFASEDLVFGQNAAKLGLRWGWFCESVELTSPWTLREFFVQRKRWLWGDLHAITRRDVLPRSRAAVIAGKYLADSLVFLISTAGLALRLTGELPPASPLYGAARLALLTWLGVFFAAGWISAGGSVDGRNDDSRLLAALTAVLFSPLSCLVTAAGLAWPLIAGNPRTFEVIRKTRNS